MRSVSEMNFCECVRKLISSVCCMYVVVCARAFVIARVCALLFFLHVSHPPPLREDKVTIIFVTAGGKCDLLSHSYCFIFFKVFVGKHLSAPRPLSALSLSVAHFLYEKKKKRRNSPSPHLPLRLSFSFFHSPISAGWSFNPSNQLER